MTEKPNDGPLSIGAGLSGNRFQGQSRGHWLEVLGTFLEAAFELRGDICVEGINRGVRGNGTITPMLVHPKPRRGILADERLELVPACLRDFLKGCVRRKFDPGMKNNPVASFRQWFAVNVDDSRAGASMRPRMGEGNARFQSETIDCHRRQLRGSRQVGQDRDAASAAERFVKTEHRSLPWYHPLTAAFAQAYKNRVEQCILEFLGNECAPHAEKTGGHGDPFEVAIVATAKDDRIPRFQFFL